MKLLLIISLMLTCQVLNTYDRREHPLPESPPIKTEWDKLIEALIHVESSGDSLIVNSIGATGWLQIMPIYVKDVNRIIGRDEYTMNCALSGKRSIEMFNIYQDHYNPTRDIYRAIKLHNPRAGEWYKQRVINQLKKL